jgi:chemotaxis protein MotB
MRTFCVAAGRFMPLSVVLLVGTTIVGCGRPNPYVRQSQLRSRQLHEQNKLLAQERDNASQSASSLANKEQRLRSDLAIANKRVGNLQSEGTQLRERYASLLNRTKNQSSPLSQDSTRRFEELARKYPGFEFDPNTGVSKFHSDILFNSGSATVKNSASRALREFADILNRSDAQRLNILVVGHTDNKRIAKSSTRAKHPTNLHLSTNRANSVVLTLAKMGLSESRMGSAGYGMHHPAVPNTDAKARQANRRVEIFVLAPDAVVANWDPGTSRR